MTIDFENQAFPQTIVVGEAAQSRGGLTKREYFAARAMQGILSNEIIWDLMRSVDAETKTGYELGVKIASMAVGAADRLISALEKQNDSRD